MWDGFQLLHKSSSWSGSLVALWETEQALWRWKGSFDGIFTHSQGKVLQEH